MKWASTKDAPTEHASACRGILCGCPLCPSIQRGWSTREGRQNFPSFRLSPESRGRCEKSHCKSAKQFWIPPVEKRDRGRRWNDDSRPCTHQDKQVEPLALFTLPGRTISTRPGLGFASGKGSASFELAASWDSPPGMPSSSLAGGCVRETGICAQSSARRGRESPAIRCFLTCRLVL